MEEQIVNRKNLLESLTCQDAGEFHWLNTSCYVCLAEGGIRITANPRCDYFLDPAGNHVMDTAPYLYLDVTGDFVAQALVTHLFKSTWDAAAIMVRQNESHWAKICFEATDFDTHAVVSVVTNGISDDANGVNYHWPLIWLQIVRKGTVFGMHYSVDRIQWNMVRYFTIEATETVQVGMVAQSPIGIEGSEMDFLNFSIEKHSVENIRAGK